jgi:hypothetical protein
MTSYGETPPTVVPPATLLEPGITITGVWHRYGTRVALADVSLQVGRGEIFGLLGPMVVAKPRFSTCSPRLCH